MNTSRAPKKPAHKDWHRADIKAALEKRGWTLRRLSQARGMAPTYLANALDRPVPRGEAIIAEVIGVPAQQIWPSRYEADGSPRRGLYAGGYDNGRRYLERVGRLDRSVRQGSTDSKVNSAGEV